MRMPAAVYHLYCPALPPLAVNVTADDPHAEAPVTVGAVGTPPIVAVTDVLVLSQVPLLIDTR